MNADQVRTLTDKALNSLSESLQAGKSEELTRYLAAMARFHHYSFGNILLICAQKPDATLVAGFHGWRKQGRFVKKGERGIAIIAPMLLRGADDSTDRSPESEEAPRVLRYRVAYVFDISQTDGEPLPQRATVVGDPGSSLDRLLAFAESRSIPVQFVDVLPGALGVASKSGIRLRTGRAPAETVSTLAHELAHMLLHLAPESERPDSKAIIETEAEAVAFTVCQAIGLDSTTAASDYIQLSQGDAKLLSASMERIRAAATTLINAVINAPEIEESHAA